MANEYGFNDFELSEIVVGESGDLHIGKTVFKTYPSSSISYGSADFLSKVLMENGFFYPYGVNLADYLEGRTSNISKLKGFDLFNELYLSIKAKVKIDSINYIIKAVENRYFTRILGKGLYQSLLKVAYKTWLAPYEDVLYKLGVGGFAFKTFIGNSPVKTYSLRQTTALIEQLVNDKLVHLGPVVMLFGRPPSEIKGVVGKSVWRKLTHFSSSRINKIIDVAYNALKCQLGWSEHVFQSHSSCSYVDEIHQGNHDQFLCDIISELANMPSSYLPHFHHSFSDTGTPNYDVREKHVNSWSSMNAKIKRVLCDKQATTQLIHTYLDTLKMAVQLGMPFNPKWSYARMMREHCSLSKLLLCKEHSDERFDHANKLQEFIEFRDSAGNAALISSPLDAAVLASAHRNCIASYIPELTQGQKLLFKINIGEKESACMLGRHGGSWMIEQHYFPCNVPVSKEFRSIESELEKLVGDTGFILPTAESKLADVVRGAGFMPPTAHPFNSQVPF